MFGAMGPEEILRAFGLPKSIIGTSAKVEHLREEMGISLAIVYLTPGVYCPAASRGCLESCLAHSSGRMKFNAATRDQRTALLAIDPELFVIALEHELREHIAAAERKGLQAAARLNGSSDVPWESIAPRLFELPLQFHDYTKIAARAMAFRRSSTWPNNYHLTWSADENDGRALQLLRASINVAMVFDGALPQRWNRFRVIDGDIHDFRWLDDRTRIVGLRAKGTAVVDRSGFVRRCCPDCRSLAVLSRPLALSRDRIHADHRCADCGRSWERSALPSSIGRGREKGCG